MVNRLLVMALTPSIVSKAASRITTGTILTNRTTWW
jgi:hypothetical protein